MTDEQTLEAASRIIADVQLSRPTYGTTAYQEDALAVAAALVAQEARARTLEAALRECRQYAVPEGTQEAIIDDALAEGRGK